MGKKEVFFAVHAETGEAVKGVRELSKELQKQITKLNKLTKSNAGFAKTTPELKSKVDVLKRSIGLLSVELEKSAGAMGIITINGKKLFNALKKIYQPQKNEATKGLDDLRDSSEEAKASLKTFADSNTSAPKVTKNMGHLRTEIERSNIELRKLKKAQKEGKISTAQFGQSAAKLESRLKGLKGKYREATNAASGLTKQGLRFRDKIAGSLMQSFKRIGLAAAAAFGVQKIKQFFTESVKLARIQRKAEADVQAALKSSGNVLGTSLDQLKAKATAFQKDTLFGDETILKKVTANMLTFKNVTGDAFDRAQQSALDLATRMDGDLKGATLQIGKALNDPATGLTMLSRAGITFNDVQKDMIKTMQQSGDLAGAQAIILTELESQFGGAAAAAAKADGGFTQFSNRVGDVQEAIGGVIADKSKGLISLGNSFLDLIDPSVSVTKSLDLQTVQINRLGKELASTNPNSEERKEIIKQINGVMPEFLNGIDEHNAGEEAIADRLKVTNSFLQQKRQLILEEAKATQIKTELDEAVARQANAQLEIDKAQAEAIGDNAQAQSSLANQQAENLILANDISELFSTISTFGLADTLEETIGTEEFYGKVERLSDVAVAGLSEELDEANNVVGILTKSMNAFAETNNLIAKAIEEKAELSKKAREKAAKAAEAREKALIKSRLDLIENETEQARERRMQAYKNEVSDLKKKHALTDEIQKNLELKLQRDLAAINEAAREKKDQERTKELEQERKSQDEAVQRRADVRILEVEQELLSEKARAEALNQIELERLQALQAIQMQNGEDTLAVSTEIAQLNNEIYKASLEELSAAEQEEADKRDARTAKAVEAVEAVAGATADLLTGQIQDTDDYKKAVIGSSLDILQVEATAAIARIIAKSFATNPVLGAVIATGGTAIVKSATNKAKSAIQQLNDGGRIDYASGAVALGPSHAQGGIPIFVNGQHRAEMQGGETVLKRGVLERFPIISAMNQALGGASLLNGAPSGMLARGGIVSAAEGSAQRQLATQNVFVSATELNRLNAEMATATQAILL